MEFEHSKEEVAEFVEVAEVATRSGWSDVEAEGVKEEEMDVFERGDVRLGMSTRRLSRRSEETGTADDGTRENIEEKIEDEATEVPPLIDGLGLGETGR